MLESNITHCDDPLDVGYGPKPPGDTDGSYMDGQEMHFYLSCARSDWESIRSEGSDQRASVIVRCSVSYSEFDVYREGDIRPVLCPW